MIAMPVRVIGTRSAAAFLLGTAACCESFVAPVPSIALHQKTRCNHENDPLPQSVPSSTWPRKIIASNLALKASGDAATQGRMPLTASPVHTENGEASKDSSAPAECLESATSEFVRKGLAFDGTPLEFKHPSTQDLHNLGMSDWVARKGVSLALVAVVQGADNKVNSCESGDLAAGAVVENLPGSGGSSVATRVCLLKHTQKEETSDAVQHALLDETITQFLNEGARISQLRVEANGSPESLDFYSRHGFVRPAADGLASPEGRILLSGDRDAGLQAIEDSLQAGINIGAVGMNLRARLLHDAGDLQGALDAYLKALELDASRSEVFRGLGGAYQSRGQHQMAFASYQQCINLAPKDLLAYLKLGMLYEELAVGKYEEAADHAIRCFDYYLQHSRSEDTDVLTRLGNLQVRRLDPAGAVQTYKRALAVNPSLANVWFNLANAHLKLEQEQEAAQCLQKKLALEPDNGVSAKYLLASLEADAERLTDADQVAYARELFDYYAPTYDDHMRKKLLYTGPRLLRKNIKDVYNATFQSLPEENRLAYNGDVLSYINGSLDILDIGCGTGLIGSWFKDYARRLVGVDVSPVMLDMATKKGCYHELRRGDIRAYLAASDEGQFDLVIAAETLQCLGRLDGIFEGAWKVLKPGGYFAVTVDRWRSRDEEGLRGGGAEGSEESPEDMERGRRPVPDAQSAGPPMGYRLKADGTYVYTRSYLEELAQRNSFEITILKRHSTTVQRGEAAPGYMLILRKAVGNVLQKQPS